jgi:hypothetical protein
MFSCFLVTRTSAATTEKPGRQRHRRTQRFERSRRQGDNETAHLAGRHLRQFPGDSFQMPVSLEGDAGPYHTEGVFSERRQVLR